MKARFLALLVFVIPTAVFISLNFQKNKDSVVHEIKCDDPWFSYLKQGIKTVEGRKGTPKHLRIKEGDKIKFVNEQNEFFSAEVRRVEKFPSLDSYLKAHLKTALPGVPNLDQGKDVYLQWSSPAEIEENGFLAIHVKRA